MHEAEGKHRAGLLWLPTDHVLHADRYFRTYFEEFAHDQSAFFEAYAAAHKQLSELGSRFEFDILL